MEYDNTTASATSFIRVAVADTDREHTQDIQHYFEQNHPTIRVVAQVRSWQSCMPTAGPMM